MILDKIKEKAKAYAEYMWPSSVQKYKDQRAMAEEDFISGAEYAVAIARQELIESVQKMLQFEVDKYVPGSLPWGKAKDALEAFRKAVHDC